MIKENPKLVSSLLEIRKSYMLRQRKIKDIQQWGPNTFSFKFISRAIDLQVGAASFFYP